MRGTMPPTARTTASNARASRAGSCCSMRTSGQRACASRRRCPTAMPSAPAATECATTRLACSTTTGSAACAPTTTTGQCGHHSTPRRGTDPRRHGATRRAATPRPAQRPATRPPAWRWVRSTERPAAPTAPDRRHRAATARRAAGAAHDDRPAAPARGGRAPPRARCLQPLPHRARGLEVKVRPEGFGAAHRHQHRPTRLQARQQSASSTGAHLPSAGAHHHHVEAVDHRGQHVGPLTIVETLRRLSHQHQPLGCHPQLDRGSHPDRRQAHHADPRPLRGGPSRQRQRQRHRRGAGAAQHAAALDDRLREQRRERRQHRHCSIASRRPRQHPAAGQRREAGGGGGGNSGDRSTHPAMISNTCTTRQRQVETPARTHRRRWRGDSFCCSVHLVQTRQVSEQGEPRVIRLARRAGRGLQH
jgi:hypothetical protein